jgi:hypothetical protein
MEWPDELQFFHREQIRKTVKMVRDAVMYGREAIKFQRNLLPLLSRYLCLLTY